jgi:transposase
MRKGPPVYSIEQKVAWVKRLLNGENVSELSRELGVARSALNKWVDQYRRGGASAMSTTGRHLSSRLKQGAPVGPVPVDDLARAGSRIAELERKIGQQHLELDFFREALRRVEELRRAKPLGAKPSTKSSRR